MEKYKFDKLKDIKCLKCNSSKMRILDDFNQNLNKEIFVNEVDAPINMYSSADLVIEWVCLDCSSYFTTCNNCSDNKILGDDYYKIDFITKESGPFYFNRFLGFRQIMNENGILRLNISIEKAKSKIMDFFGIDSEEYNKLDKEVIEINDTTDIIPYYTGDLGMYYINEKELVEKTLLEDDIMITGDDGGESHIWKCDNCKCVNYYTDK